ncbi:MAG: MetS family NSS transporter small subunit [candidate division Zixibacteria bacterium]|nr:MetS family NSS transporter small subunit [candidate division Zixibacteria bacterium]
MPASAWIMLLINGGILFGGLLYCALRAGKGPSDKNNDI